MEKQSPVLSKAISRRSLLFGRNIVKEDDGATAIEYGLMAALIGIAIIGGSRALGRRAKNKFVCTKNKVNHISRGTIPKNDNCMHR